MRLIILIFVLLFNSVTSQDDKYLLSTVAFYNVENLFDADDDPKNNWDQKWLEEGTWTEDIYKQKLENISNNTYFN